MLFWNPEASRSTRELALKQTKGEEEDAIRPLWFTQLVQLVEERRSCSSRVTVRSHFVRLDWIRPDRTGPALVG